MAAAIAKGNLEAQAQDTQMRMGIIALAVALGFATSLAKLGASPGYRALAFVPFLFAAYGVLAALYRTCGVTAMAGRRITCDGSERVADRGELAGQRRQGLRVIGGSLLLAVTATALLVSAS